MNYFYTAYGLTISTTFPCPVLASVPADQQPDIQVVEGEVAYSLHAPLAEDPDNQWQAESGRFLMRAGSRTGRFLAEGGTRVTLQRGPTAEDRMLAFFFLDSVLAALLLQRGMLVLHANAAVTPKGALAVSGPSGAGKSTTLAALLQRGCSMLSDDITALKSGVNGIVEALPGIPQLHLTEDSAAALGTDISELPRFAWRRMKAAVPTLAAMSAKSAPLHALYVMETHPLDNLNIRLLGGMEKFAALQECIYGPLLPEEHPGQFPLFAAVMAQVNIYRVQRPAGRWSVEELADKILEN